MTDPSGEMALACEIGLPPSTSASPSCPNQSVQAVITWSCSSLVSGMLPPWNVSRKFAMSIALRVPRHICAAASRATRRSHVAGSERTTNGVVPNQQRMDAMRSGVGRSAQALPLAPQAFARAALPSYQSEPWPGLAHHGWAVVHVAGRGDVGPDPRLD